MVATGLIVKRKLYKVWLSKLESVTREIKIYELCARPCRQFQIIGFLLFCQCFTLFVIFIFIFKITFSRRNVQVLQQQV